MQIVNIYYCANVLFQYDANYVGTVLPKEVTFCNLNNNINDSFLREMCASHGVIDDVKIYYHPKTRRHLGIGKVTLSLMSFKGSLIGDVNSQASMI